MKRRTFIGGLGLVAAAAATSLPLYAISKLLKVEDRLAQDIAHHLRLIPIGGIATIMKVSNDEWMIYGDLGNFENVEHGKITGDFSRYTKYPRKTYLT